MATEVSRNSIPGASEIDGLWPFGANATVAIALMVAFWLGVAATMFTYQIGFLEVAR